MNTRQIKVISITRSEFEQEVQYMVADRVNAILEQMKTSLAEISTFTEQILAEESWILMLNQDVYYNYNVNGIFPNFRKFSFGHNTINKGFLEDSFIKEFSGFTGSLMTLEEFQTAFTANISWFQNKFPHPAEDIYFSVAESLYCYSITGEVSKKWGSFSREEAYHIPIYRLKKPEHDLNPMQVLYLWLKNELIPQKLPRRLFSDYNGIIQLLKSGRKYFNFENGTIALDDEIILEAIMNEEIKELNGESIDVENIKIEMESIQPITHLSENGKTDLITKLLDCDKVRCDIESYDEKILSDPNRGHWDLWEEPKTSAKYTVKLKNGLIARNPSADINYDGVIGIDFGTKSTVVVYQENTEHTLPMRIGTGQISKKVEAKHYENPTVMELINLDKFLESYYSCAGRPETCWEDLVISHTANSSMLNSSSIDYYSFFHEFKQWAGDKRRQIRLKDKMGKDILLPPFQEIEENAFNPIEIYAYYIGLYINNMYNGIYLDYIMSFPVTYETAVRNKIKESFERGLKKSLPMAVLENETAMKRFRVSYSISEPAAYAICALEESYNDLDDNEQIYYGIFDFGGGTTDFDYGVWRESGKNERKYDYVLECFGAGGDQYLGGENLLELLAFEIFTDNQDLLRSERISFVLPPECKKFPGSEVLLSESQEAKLNMRQLMEALRPYWEQQEGYQNLFDDGTILLTLFTKEGEPKVNFELKVSKTHIDAILKSRINKGVYNFFEGLKSAFHLPNKEIEQIDIFLAGNSSRSSIVIELFTEYIEQYTAFVQDMEGRAETFIVHAPLGFNDLENKSSLESVNSYLSEKMYLDEAAYSKEEIYSEKDTYSEEDYSKKAELMEDLSYITRPTGKTGVAFGLIEGRPGGRIKVALMDQPKDSEGKQSEIKFRYFIGYKKKQCFRIVSDRDIPYMEWVELYDASEEDFTIYYTSLPEALTNQMSILDVCKKNCRLNRNYKDANIYYRPISPTTIEYVAAREDGILNGEYLEDPVQVELS